MKLGAKSLIFLVLLIFNAAKAEWNADAWPSEINYRLVPTNFFSATNLWAKKTAEKWEQQSTTNFIPQIILSNYVAVGPDFEIPMSYHTPIGRHTNDFREWTNTYWNYISADPSTNVTGPWDDETMGGSGVYAFSFQWPWPIGGEETNNVETSVSINFSSDSREWGLDVPHIWAWDTYAALQERYRALNQESMMIVTTTNRVDNQDVVTDHLVLTTNVWNPREASMFFKPEFYRNERQNLIAYKEWIAGNLGRFVDHSQSSDGTFDEYFDQFVSWQWVTTYTVTTNADPCILPVEDRYQITTNRFWEPTKRPDDFPMMDKESLVVLAGLPHQQGAVTTITYTAHVPGWFACDTNVFIASNHTFTVTTTTAMTRTWFDYTPYRDFGGWGQGLSNQVSGVWRFNLRDYWRPETQTWAIADSVANPFMVRFDPSTNEVGIVTSAVFSIFRHWTEGTNNFPQTINGVRVLSPCLADQISPRITITVTNPAYSVTFTNYSAAINLPNGSTAIVFSAVYTNAIVITNNFAAELELIATDTTEADYGYKFMRQAVSNLSWTAHNDYANSTSAAYRGQWNGGGCALGQTDTAPWIYSETNSFGFPSGVKESGSLSLPPIPDDGCEVFVPPPDFSGDCEFSARYTILEPGCYIGTGTFIGDAGVCDFSVFPSRTFGGVTVTVTGPYLTYFEVCCPDGGGVKVTRTYKRSACLDVDYGDCDFRDNNGAPIGHFYGYKRNSQVIQFNALPPGLLASRAIYFIGTKPFDQDDQPDNESGWQGTLLNTYSQYVTTQETGIYSLNDFHKNTRPFGGSALEIKGWQITGALELRKWDFEYK